MGGVHFGYRFPISCAKMVSNYRFRYPTESSKEGIHYRYRYTTTCKNFHFRYPTKLSKPGIRYGFRVGSWGNRRWCFAYGKGYGNLYLEDTTKCFMAKERRGRKEELSMAFPLILREVTVMAEVMLPLILRLTKLVEGENQFPLINRKATEEALLRALPFLIRRGFMGAQALDFSFLERKGTLANGQVGFAFNERRGILSGKQADFAFLIREGMANHLGCMDFSFLVREAAKAEESRDFSFLLREVAKAERMEDFSFLFREIASVKHLLDFSLLLREIGTVQGTQDFSFLIREIAQTIGTQDFSFLIREGADALKMLDFSFLIREIGKAEGTLAFSFLIREIAQGEKTVDFSFLLREIAKAEITRNFSFIIREGDYASKEAIFSFIIRQIVGEDSPVLLPLLLKDGNMEALIWYFSFIIRQSLMEAPEVKSVRVEAEISQKDHEQQGIRQIEKDGLTEADSVQLMRVPRIKEGQAEELACLGERPNGAGHFVHPLTLAKESHELGDIMTGLLGKCFKLGEESKGHILSSAKAMIQVRDSLGQVNHSVIVQGGQSVANEKTADKTLARTRELKVLSEGRMGSDWTFGKKRERLVHIAKKTAELESLAIEGRTDQVEASATKGTKMGNVSDIDLMAEKEPKDSSLDRADQPADKMAKEAEAGAMIKDGEKLPDDGLIAYEESDLEKIAKPGVLSDTEDWLSKIGEFEEEVFASPLMQVEMEVRALADSLQALKLPKDATKMSYEAFGEREIIKYGQSLSTEQQLILKQRLYDGLIELSEALSQLKPRVHNVAIEEPEAMARRLIEHEGTADHQHYLAEDGERQVAAELVSSLLEGSTEEAIKTVMTLLAKEKEVVKEADWMVESLPEGVVKDLERKFKLYQRFWIIGQSDYKDWLILPAHDYPYEAEPLVFDQLEHEDFNQCVYPNAFYKIIDCHPIQAGQGIGREEIGVSVGIMVDLVNIYTLMWAKFTPAFWGWTGTQAVTGMIEAIHEYITLESAQKVAQDKGVKAEYERAFQWLRWMGEAVVLLARDDLALRGNYYVEVLLGRLVDYLVDHHVDVMPIFHDVNQMDLWRASFEREEERAIKWVLDKVKGIRHKVLEAKNMIEE